MRKKRGLAFLLCVLLTVLAGCQAPAAGGQEEFDALMADLVPDLIDMDAFSSRFYFLQPESRGLPAAGSGFGLVSEEDWDEAVKKTREALQSLEGIDEKKLDVSSRLTLRIVKDALERSLALEDFYLLACNSPGIGGDAAQLATLVAHAPYQSREDIDALLAMYESLPETFSALLALEEERQKQGMGMTREEIDLALGEYERIMEGAEELGAEVIRSSSFLTAEEKERYLERNAEIVSTALLPAYRALCEGLDAMEGRSGVPGTAGREGGREYVLALLKTMGVDETPEELMQELQEGYVTCSEAAYALVPQTDPELLAAYIEDPASFQAMGDADAEEIVRFQQAAAAEVFPPEDTGKVEVVLTPEVLREQSTVAYYMLQPLDALPTAPKNIYINDETTAADYLVLAHEGFPGHLYQDTYAASQNRDAARRIAERGYQAALEGWGVYSTVAAAELAEENREMTLLAALMDVCDRLLAAWLDLAYNYFGWTPQEVQAVLEDEFGISIPELEGEFTDAVCAMPGDYLAYGIGGLRLLKMREKAQKALGEAYSPQEFHRAVLDVLPASLAQLEQAADSYIAGERRNEAA